MRIFLSILSVFVFLTAKSQNTSLAAPTFIKTYGDTLDNIVYGVTAVGKYYIYVGRNDTMPTMTQVDLNGNLVTSKRFDEYGEITNVYATNDGNVIFNLNHVGNTRDDKFQLIKYNPNTQSVIWHKGYDLAGRFFAVTMAKNEKDEIFVSHWHDESVSLSDNYNVVKLDANGNIMWSKTIVGGDAQFYAITSLKDGGCVVAGETIRSSTRKSNVVRLDAQGNMVFRREYDWWGDQTAYYSINVLDDGNLLAAGQNLTLKEPIMCKLNINNGDVIGASRRITSNSRYSFYSTKDLSGNIYLRLDDLDNTSNWIIDKFDKNGDWLQADKISNTNGGTAIATNKNSPENLIMANSVDKIFGGNDVQLAVTDLDMKTNCTVSIGMKSTTTSSSMVVTTPNISVYDVTYKLESPSYVQPLSLCEKKSCSNNTTNKIEIDINATLCQGSCFVFKNQQFCSSADLVKSGYCGVDTVYHIKLKIDTVTAKGVVLASCPDALGNTCFDLNSVKTNISSNPAAEVNFYLDAACTQAIASPFCTNGSISNIYTRVAKDSCYAIAQLQLIVSKQKTTTQNIVRCEGESFAYKNQVFTSTAFYEDKLTAKNGCDSIHQLNIIFNPIAKKQISINQCSGSTYLFAGQTLNKTGIYTDVKKRNNACDSITTLYLSFEKPDTFRQSKTICKGESINVGASIYTNEGIYFNLIKNKTANCDSLIIVTKLTVLTPKDSILNQTICEGEIFKFNNKDYTQSGIYRDSILFSTTKCVQYKLLLNLNVENCAIKIDSLKIKNNLCFGEEKGSISFTLSGTGVKPYLVEYQNITTKVAYKNADKLPAGTYLIAIKDSGLGTKQLKKDTTITISEPPQIYVNIGVNQTIMLGDSVFLDVKTNATKLLWENALPCLNCKQTWVFPKKSTLYSIKASNNNDCIAKDSVTITVINDVSIYIPNSFSPNDDGKNDIFTVYGKSDIFQIQLMRIFDRWGALLYENTNFPPNALNQLGWDGTYKKQAALQGIYTYYIVVKLINDEEKVFKGDVMLYGNQ